jgi:hypothetical protein
MAIDIMQSAYQNDPIKGIKVPGTGLTLYPGGMEKTPTGKSNAFANSGLSPEEVVVFAKTYGLPVSSNKEFQEAAINKLMSTPMGKQHLVEMEKVYGIPKAGTFVDDILGARTKYLLQGLEKVKVNKEKDLKNYEENRPLLGSNVTGRIDEGFNQAADWAWDFGKDKEAYERYNSAPTSYSSMKAQEDSARRGLSPKGAKVLTKLQTMQRLNEDTEANRNYFNKYGEFPYPMKTSAEGVTDKTQRLNDFLRFRYGKNYK